MNEVTTATYSIEVELKQKADSQRAYIASQREDYLPGVTQETTSKGTTSLGTDLGQNQRESSRRNQIKNVGYVGATSIGKEIVHSARAHKIFQSKGAQQTWLKTYQDLYP